MNYRNKWIVGFGTLPFVVCSILLGAVVPYVHITVIALVAFFISTISYQKLIATAPLGKQKFRFSMFFIFPIITTFGVMYI